MMTKNRSSIGSLVEQVENIHRLIDLIESSRERLVRVLGHTCPEPESVHEEDSRGD